MNMYTHTDPYTHVYTYHSILFLYIRYRVIFYLNTRRKEGKDKEEEKEKEKPNSKSMLPVKQLYQESRRSL